jgi:hypothetical protein
MPHNSAQHSDAASGASAVTEVDRLQQCRSGRHWSATKHRLAFCTVTQDGSTEGCLRLHHLPTPDQATVIRDVLGIRKRMELAPGDLERRRASMSRLSPAPGSANATTLVPEPLPKQEPISASER